MLTSGIAKLQKNGSIRGYFFPYFGHKYETPPILRQKSTLKALPAFADEHRKTPKSSGLHSLQKMRA